MKPIVILGSEGKTEIMEVIGPDGLKAGELEIKAKDKEFKPPYGLINEAQNNAL